MKARALRYWILVPLLLMVVFAGAASGTGGEVIPRTTLNHDPAQVPLYDRYPVWAYTVDSTAADGSIRQLQHLLNGLNSGKAWVLKLALRSMEYAVAWRLPQELLVQAEGLLGSLRSLFWEGELSVLVLAGIAVAGLGALLLAGAMGRGRAAWGLLLRTFLLLAVAAIGFDRAGPMLKGAASLNADLTTAVFATTNRLSVPIEARSDNARTTRAALTGSGDALWRVSVLYPWALQEFGSLESAGLHADQNLPGGKLLSKTANQRSDYYWSQPQAVRERDFAWWQEEALPRRLTVAVGSALSTMVVATLILLVAGSVLVYQAFLLLLTALLPLVFLLALWPGFGGELLRRWGQSAFQAVLGQLLFVALLGVAVPLIQAAAGMESAMGWEAILFLQVGLAFALLVAWRTLLVRWVRPGRGKSSQGGATERGVLGVIRRWKSAKSERSDGPTEPQPASIPLETRSVLNRVGETVARELMVERTRMLLNQAGRQVPRPTGLAVADSPTVMGAAATQTEPAASKGRVTDHATSREPQRPATLQLPTSRPTARK